MSLNISVDAHLVTLTVSSYQIVDHPIQVGRTTQVRRERVEVTRRIAPRYDPAAVRRAVDLANRIWAPADIRFVLRTCAPGIAAAPDNTEEVNEAGFFFLAKKFPAQHGVSLLLVHKFRSQHLGGQAAEELCACILPSLGHPLAGKTLAHEFGHLLSLPDLEDDHYNVMYKALRAADNLTDPQKQQARQSNLAQNGGPAGSP